MPKERLIMTLAKVLIAAAWADGELSHEEVNSMKDLLWRLPQISARDWASLQIYIDSPVGNAERARLVSDLQQAIRTAGDRDLVLATLDQLMHAAVLVSILSPRYLKSEWCNKELSTFYDHAQECNDLYVDNKSRIFKVLKTSTAQEPE